MGKMRKLALVVLFLFVACFYESNFIYAKELVPNIGNIQIWQERNDADGNLQQCGFLTSCAEAGKDVHIKLTNITYNDGRAVPDDVPVEVSLNSNDSGCESVGLSRLIEDNVLEVTFEGFRIKTKCKYNFVLRLPSHIFGVGDIAEAQRYISSYAPEVEAACGEDECNSGLGVLKHSLYELCSQIKKDTKQYDACEACFTSDGVWTAVGCIPSQPESIIKTFITIGLGIGGGVVLVMIMIGSFMLSVSQGDPNKTKEAKEIITSAIIGLLFVIFSVTILQFIGVSILHIPGFGE